MLESTVASFQDNSAHGEDNFLIRDLGNGNFFDAVMDGVTGHGGEEASQSVQNIGGLLSSGGMTVTGTLVLTEPVLAPGDETETEEEPPG